MSNEKIERFGDVEIPIEVGGLFDRYRMEPDLDEIAKLPGVEEVAFFRDQEKSLVSFQDWDLLMPAFYYDLGFCQAVFLADLAALRGMLPTDALEPLAVWPGTGLIAFTAFEYRVTDIDAYNEFSIAVLTRRPGSRVPGPISALVSQVRRTNWAFVWKLPVTTELACHGGKVGYNYPKYVTDLPWGIEGDTVTAEIRNGDAMEVRLSGRVLPTRPGGVVLNHAMSFQDGNVLDIPI
ncbi:MAG: acetoacetate decarboxylase family protein, partial [Deltaproteobacteria bacterium]|nr:acetoacetate decarboxylase family protein [Deltaproteobacteria bacterium]